MQTTKQRAIQALSTLPDDATIDDAIEQLCFLAKVEEGLRDSDAGRMSSHEEIREQLLA
jgi:predicted transcriptional regulator